MLVAGAGCGARQQTGDSGARLQREERLAQMNARLGRIEEQIGDLARLAAQIDLRLTRLDDIAERVASMERQVGRARPQRPQRPSGPDPDTVYAVPVGDSPFEGPAHAKVTIVEAFEFACPFCERARATMRQIRKQYGKDVRIVYKTFLVHPGQATAPALAACAAQAQGKFLPMKEAIWEDGYKDGRDLSEKKMNAIARRLDLNMRRFKGDMKGDACAERIKEEQAMMGRVGTRGTPTFYINGRPLRGAQPFPAFKAVIDEELAKANEVIRTQRIKPRDYYEHVVEGGRSSL